MYLQEKISRKLPLLSAANVSFPTSVGTLFFLHFFFVFFFQKEIEKKNESKGCDLRCRIGPGSLKNLLVFFLFLLDCMLLYYLYCNCLYNVVILGNQ